MTILLDRPVEAPVAPGVVAPPKQTVVVHLPDPVVEALWQARGKVQHGWCQHTSSTTDRWGRRRVCAGQAITEAAGCDQALCNRVADAFIKTIGDRWAGCIPTWNDTYGRTQAEVLAVFDRTIRRLTV